MVEVVTAEVGVAVGGFHLEHSVAEFKDGNIESTSSEVEYCDFLLLGGLVKSVCERCGCRLVDDTHHLQACDLSGVLCSLALRVVEVSRDCNDRFRHGLAEIVFRGLLHFLKNHG